MGEELSLPPELEDMICKALADDHSWLAITNCALVSKRWLHQSRRHYFMKKRVSLHVKPWRDSDRLLGQILSRSGTRCTFWPYILDLHISDDSYAPYNDRPREKNNTNPVFVYLLSLCIANAINLRTLRLCGFCFFGLPGGVIKRITSSKTITSIQTYGVKFTSPSQLCTFLAALKHLRVQCKLGAVCFVEQGWEPTGPARFVADPSLRFRIDTANSDVPVLLKVIRHHSWNICKLALEPETLDDGEYEAMQEVLRQAGPSLKKLYLPIINDGQQGPISFTLEHNTSLEILDVGEIGIFRWGAAIPSTGWLVSLLETIQSRRRFRSLRGWINFHTRPDGMQGGYEHFDWRSIEDVLLDEERFPGNKLVFRLELIDESEWSVGEEKAYTLIRERYLSRLQEAGRLECMY